jgi:hypothetical protein
LGGRQAQFTDSAYLSMILNIQRSTDQNVDLPHRRRRYVMKKFIAALALFTIIAIPTLSTSVNAATVSPFSSEFGSNGY